MNAKEIVSRPAFHPLSPLLLISQSGVSTVPPESLSVELVGEKAFGLSCLPGPWTLPFVVVSHEMLFLYKDGLSNHRDKLLRRLCDNVKVAAEEAGLEPDAPIIVRSSGCAEGLEKSGQLYSMEGTLSNCHIALMTCLDRLATDADLVGQRIPLVVQKHIVPVSAKGHLSNERRFYEESRDWLGQFEGKKGTFQINLRNWREKVNTEKLVERPIECNLSALVPTMLKIPASWAYERNQRIHFEWVWDGKAVFLVQANQDSQQGGVDPTRTHTSRTTGQVQFVPQCLREITPEHARRYSKVRNVFTYLKLGLPITKFYVLDDQRIIASIAQGDISPELENDIRALVNGSLVIRMDITSEDMRKRQLLPRTEEVREIGKAINWLKETIKEFMKANGEDNVVFIFHNFVPAVSSAFALAAPMERKVQIEALWGLPEGLYYNAHDKYIVDTKTPRTDELKARSAQFSILRRTNYKHFFISPDSDGSWTSKVLRPPYDWKETIQKEDWIREIALQSRRIADEEKKPLSIMWLLGVSRDSFPSEVIPWYHEPFDLHTRSRASTHRAKTPFDKSLIIKTTEDINTLNAEADKARSSVRLIRIQPEEERLLRDKNTLSRIGKLSQRIGAVILLEGGVLSHAYYQLLGTNAIVEVQHPFRDIDDKREFNKLVRDKVALNIKQGGELVTTTQLSDESFLRALREKLVEEAFEALDAVDKDSIVNELADVSEVIDETLKRLGVGKKWLATKQKQKRELSGGFKEGMVLLETRNPLPMERSLTHYSLFGEDGTIEPGAARIDEQAVLELAHKIDRSSDRREHQAATEVKLRLSIPMVRDEWTAFTPETVIDLYPPSGVKAKITGRRDGARLQLEVSVFAQQKQPGIASNQLTFEFGAGREKAS